MFHIPHADCAGEQLPVLYYKEGERLSELSNYMREGSEQLVEVQTQSADSHWQLGTMNFVPGILYPAFSAGIL